MTTDEVNGKSIKELVIQTLEEVADIKERVIRMEEREHIVDNSDHRKMTCPWNNERNEVLQSLAVGARHFKELEDSRADHERRISDIEKSGTKVSAQASLAYTLFEWAWKLGLIGLLLKQISDMFL